MIEALSLSPPKPHALMSPPCRPLVMGDIGLLTPHSLPPSCCCSSGVSPPQGMLEKALVSACLGHSLPLTALPHGTEADHPRTGLGGTLLAWKIVVVPRSHGPISAYWLVL